MSGAVPSVGVGGLTRDGGRRGRLRMMMIDKKITILRHIPIDVNILFEDSEQS